MKAFFHRLARRLAAVAIVIGLAWVCGIAIAVARPGGGHSFSGGGGHSSSSSSSHSSGGGFSSSGGSHYYGGGGGGTISGGMIALIVVAIVIFIVVAIIKARMQAGSRKFDEGPAVPMEAAIDLTALRDIDPDFSQVLFEDFAFRLFSTAHRARSSQKQIATVAPYVSPDAQQVLLDREPKGAPVESVVVGALRVCGIDVGNVGDETTEASNSTITVQFEANVTAGVSSADHTYYSVEAWTFSRNAAARTKPPGASHGFPCPNCGAQWQADDTGTQVCAFCKQAVDNGRFDWVVEAINLESIDERPPTLTATVEEQGNDVPSYLQAGVDDNFTALTTDDPAITREAISQRLSYIFHQLNVGWSSNDLRGARGVVSDSHFDYLQYWITEYKKQHLRNIVDDARITNIEICKVLRDRWFDAITIRIWGTGRDYTIREPDGEVLAGSKTKERAYTEYWTLIRSSQRRGATKLESTCANCGAPLVITMGGDCEHCKAHVTAGEFDWVLSKIEQDDTYRG